MTYFLFSDPTIAASTWRSIYFGLRLNEGTSMYPQPIMNVAGDTWALLCTDQVKDRADLYDLCMATASGTTNTLDNF